jgi:hypothetical protein
MSRDGPTEDSYKHGTELWGSHKMLIHRSIPTTLDIPYTIYAAHNITRIKTDKQPTKSYSKQHILTTERVIHSAWTQHAILIGHPHLVTDFISSSQWVS